MELSIVFMGNEDPCIENAVKDLESKIKGIKVSIARFPNRQAQFVPSPYAFFEGQNKVHEYGSEAALKLIEDIAQQRQY